jgi:vacuolar-type H+-ATPase subunit H
MPRVRDFLDRFRPAGAPGAATAAGVPVERGLDLETELAPVFAALAAAQEECAVARRQAQREATDLSQEAATRAAAIVAGAHATAPAARAEEMARARQAADAETARLMADAEREAGAIRASARQRQPELLDRVMTVVRTELGPPQPAALGAAGRGEVPS